METEDIIRNFILQVPYTLEEYKEALKRKVEPIDCSHLNLWKADIQNVNLENRGLDIDLRNIFIPYGGSVKIGHNVISSIFAVNDDFFLHLEHTNLKGNNVTGDLKIYKNYREVYPWYTPDTFDDIYKQQHQQFFLAENAPLELKDKYYNKKLVKLIDPLTLKTVDTYERQTLTFAEFVQYYEFLKDKYLANFKIDDLDRARIILVKMFGFDKFAEIINNLANSCLPLEKSLLCIANMTENELKQLFSDNTFLKEDTLQTLDKVKKLSL